ncbi:FAD-binding domain-containing protein [Nostoc sp. 'Peltigera membranacea cyanobiont' 232]|uniref:FAD-binding domain-containing protein n=1 Tax=Nostoc sp. 'Peltigera membranacea cyanobiont' 232 TaxID=2014531 RepID=UPI000B9538BA|nr:FAD-binding domain-containing protein [Nostoc sp. 'Peltigera membranacea cyanobiont' 232]OYE01936.1 deoxyribodipyrimidine photolyase [Nostoc sp. 'Peltigera membranacea cyanobiont' 232]
MHLLWFRRDLRLTDNEIVTLASANNAAVLPFFIIDPWFYQWVDVGKGRVRFLFESLENLDSNLQKLGSKLILFEGNSVEIIQELTQQLTQQGHRPKLYLNRDVQVEYGISRDKSIVNLYQGLNLEYHLGLNNFLQSQDKREQWFNEYYTYQRKSVYPTPTSINTPSLSLNVPQIKFSELKHKYRAFLQTEQVYFIGGETQAQATLNSFLKSRFNGYHWKLSRPWLAQQGATSHLSPHLTFGTISTRIVYQSTKARAAELTNQPKAEFSLKAFRDRLRWHDSFTQRLYFYPEIAYKNRYPEFDEWYTPLELPPEKQELFHAWQEGMTGFPLLDASMRQLKTMGWMNFRMRAMCATFLTINCGISWHHGARHYMNYLVDGDLAIDNWQWQMQSGVTNPLSDTFRIYNPNKNITEKDPDLKFIYYWVSELKGYSLPEIIQGKYIGTSSYPQTILDWAKTRKVNGKIISDLRKKVRERLTLQGGTEYESAVAAKETVNKYWQHKDRQYKEFKELEAELE